jgi:predicted metal-dependent phosphoesterase TrpH
MKQDWNFTDTDRVDLHVHSTYSDGTCTPEQIVQDAVAARLSCLALTDHDTMAGVKEAQEAGIRAGLPVIAGAELSTQWKSREIHIVGLFLNPDDAVFREQLDDMRDGREKRNRKMAGLITQRGMPIDYDELKARSGGTITRANFARYMLEKGYINSIEQAFAEYIGDKCPCYVPREKTPAADAVKMIHENGGAAILAHPMQYKLGHDGLDELVGHLTGAGLDGIECWYSSFTPADTQDILEIAKRFSLLPSGGSDFHGANKPDIQLGTGRGSLFVPGSVVSRIAERADSWKKKSGRV